MSKYLLLLHEVGLAGLNHFTIVEKLQSFSINTSFILENTCKRLEMDIDGVFRTPSIAGDTGCKVETICAFIQNVSRNIPHHRHTSIYVILVHAKPSPRNKRLSCKGLQTHRSRSAAIRRAKDCLELLNWNRKVDFSSFQPWVRLIKDFCKM